MKILKWTGIVLGTIILLALIVSIFLPSRVEVKRELVINAPAENVYEQIINFKNWPRWSAFVRADSTLKPVYSGADQGVGASYSWTAEEMGDGKIDIREAAFNDSIRMAMYFQESKEPAWGIYRFKKEGEGVKVTMVMIADMPFYMRLMGLMMKGMVGEKYDESLKNLKTIAEEGPKKKEYEVIETTQLEQHYLGLRDTASPATVGAKYQQNFPALFEAAMKSGSMPVGPPFSFVHSQSDTLFDLEWAVPVAKAPAASGNFKPGVLKGGKVARVEYYGPYEETGNAYGSIMEWAAKNGKKISGSPWEVYITDPMAENGKMDRVLTIVYMPIE